MEPDSTTSCAPSYAPNTTKNFEDTNPFRNTNNSHHGSFGKASISSGYR